MIAKVGSLSQYFGFDPNSQYAELFSQIYHLTKVTPVAEKISIASSGDDEDLEEGEFVEDGEIYEHNERKNDQLGIEATVVVKDENQHNDHLTDEVDFQPPLGQVIGEAPLDYWKEGWMKISRDAMSWNQSNNQNQNMTRNPWNKQLPPLPPPTAPFQQLPGTNQPNSSIFQGTNQINSSIFTSGSQNGFSIPPPPIQLPPWNQNPFFLPANSPQGFNFPNLLGNPNPMNFPPPLIDQGRVANMPSPEEKEMLEHKGVDLRTQFDLDENPVRKNWLIKYMEFQASRGTPLTSCPVLHKKPLDLYKLYYTVMEEGGFANCTAKKGWKKVFVKMTSNNRQTSRLLQKLFRKLLLQFENYETGQPEDLSMAKQSGHQERNERSELGERKVLLPLQNGGTTGGVSVSGEVHWVGGGSAGAQWGAVSASYNLEEGGQECGRADGVKKGKQRRKRI